MKEVKEQKKPHAISSQLSISLFELDVEDVDLIPLSDPIDQVLPDPDPILPHTSSSLTQALQYLKDYTLFLSLLQNRQLLRTVFNSRYTAALEAVKTVASEYSDVRDMACCNG